MAQPAAVVQAGLDAAKDLPVVVVGTGPVGIHFVAEYFELHPSGSLILYGEEPCEPYNRIHLTSLLAGDVDREDICQSPVVPDTATLETHYGVRITSIDPVEQIVNDDAGNIIQYGRLVLATGSTPFVPPINGIQQEGVFTFRNLNDVKQLQERASRGGRVVILGGGLLGLEAARGMLDAGAVVTVVERSDALMSRQLDESGSEILLHHVSETGVDVQLGVGVLNILGDGTVRGVELSSGELLPCDTVIVATGIRPNMKIAQSAGLRVGSGVVVDAGMAASYQNIFAIGECIEFNGQTFGMLSPGLEQARVAAANLYEKGRYYHGSIDMSKLKVFDFGVFSIGDTNSSEDKNREYVYLDEKKAIYRKLFVCRGRVVGAMAVGDWPEAMRLQWAITKREMIESWMLEKFLTDGLLWGNQLQQDVANWPSEAIVCQCVGVSRGVIGDVIETGGAVNVNQVCKRTSACSVCGSCKPLISQLLGVNPDSVRFQMLLLTSALMAAIWGFWSFFGDKLPYVDTVDISYRWDLLWTDGIIKQITGYLILGLAVLVGGVSLRKRVKKFHSVGKFEVWRVIHVVISVGLIAMMVAHTGLRMGDGMNFWLTSAFAVMVLAGVILTIVIGMEHHLEPMRARVLHSKANSLHLMLIWPFPVLLVFHIIKIYYY